MKTINEKNSVKKNQVINDFGQKIGGAHKDRAREAAEKLAGVDASALMLQPLSKVAKLPDLRGLYLAGAISERTARRARYYWDCIGSKPGSSYPSRLQRWADRAAALIQNVADVLTYGDTEKSPIFNNLEGWKPAQSWEIFREEMTAANWPEDEYKRGAYFVGHYWMNPARYSIHTEKASYYTAFDTVADAVAYITRCIDATPTQEEGAPSDSPKGEGCDADGAAYGIREKSQNSAAPADGLELVDLAGGGVAVTGDSRTTYKARKEIKSHGATWNKAAKQWEAHDPAAVAALREWFGVTVQDATPEASAPALPEPPAVVTYDPAQPIESAPFVASSEVEPTTPTDGSQPTTEDTPTDGATGAAYGSSEKSQIPEAVEVTEYPDVKEYRLMYLFGAWVCHSRVYAETDAEAIEDATDNYLTSTLPRWPYRVALWDGSRLVHEFKGDGPDDIGRRDMEQEESMFFPVYKVFDASLEASDPNRYYSAVSLLKAADRVTNNEHTASPHHLQILCDGLKIWDSEENTKLHLVDIVRQRLAMPYGDAEKSQIQETMRAEAQREEVRDWYMFQYPTDEEGANIQAGATFADIMANPARVYDYIPSDSIIRERVFRETANRYGVEYSEIYSRWMDEEGAPSDSPKGESCDADGAA